MHDEEEEEEEEEEEDYVCDLSLAHSLGMYLPVLKVDQCEVEEHAVEVRGRGQQE